MQYKSVVTVPRVKASLIVIWVVSVIYSLSFFYVPMTTASILAVYGISKCLLVTVVCYAMSFQTLKKYCAQVGPQQSRPNRASHSTACIHIIKYRKLLKTMLIILIFIIICFSILAITSYLILLKNQRRSLLWGFMTIASLNSIVNPVVYLLRMRDIRQACRRSLNLRKVFNNIMTTVH